MNDPRTPGEGLIYRVDMILPPRALGVRAALVDALRRSNRGIGVITGEERGRGLYLAVLITADDEHAARTRAQRLVAAALQEVGVAELASQIDVGQEVTSRPALRGGPHRIAPPPLAYRSSTLPDGRVVNAARNEPLGEWFAYVEDRRDHAIAGRSLREVLDTLLELPWGRHPRWVDDAIAQLAGHTTSHGVRYQCPCCDHLTLQNDPSGTNATCEVCQWEDDRVQLRDPDHAPGANRLSLRQARRNYRRHGASDLDRGASAREPRPDEIL